MKKAFAVPGLDGIEARAKQRAIDHEAREAELALNRATALTQANGDESPARQTFARGEAAGLMALPWSPKDQPRRIQHSRHAPQFSGNSSAPAKGGDQRPRGRGGVGRGVVQYLEATIRNFPQCPARDFLSAICHSRAYSVSRIQLPSKH